VHCVLSSFSFSFSLCSSSSSCGCRSGFEKVGQTLLEIKTHADKKGIFNPAPVTSVCGGKSKSLAVLAHQFISMFVTDACPRSYVTLDEAAACLAKDDATPAEIKTKARRLYDIANRCCK
jgi:hypothetical protein